MPTKGRPPINKVPFCKERFKEALIAKGMKLEDLNINETADVSVKTIRNALREGKINPDTLDRIGKCLDVNPDYLSGVFDANAEYYSFGNKEEEAKLRSLISVSDHPYIEKLKHDIDIWDIIGSLLIYNNVPGEKLDELSREDLIRFYIEITRCTRNTIKKYFTPLQYGYIESSIPMPPEDEIYHMD